MGKSKNESKEGGAVHGGGRGCSLRREGLFTEEGGARPQVIIPEAALLASATGSLFAYMSSQVVW